MCGVVVLDACVCFECVCVCVCLCVKRLLLNSICYRLQVLNLFWTLCASTRHDGWLNRPYFMFFTLLMGFFSLFSGHGGWLGLGNGRGLQSGRYGHIWQLQVRTRIELYLCKYIINIHADAGQCSVKLYVCESTCLRTHYSWKSGNYWRWMHSYVWSKRDAAPE